MGVAFPIPEIAQNWGQAIGSMRVCVRVRAIRPTDRAAASLAFFPACFAVASFNAARSSDRTGNHRDRLIDWCAILVRARADQSIVIAENTVKQLIFNAMPITHNCQPCAKLGGNTLNSLKYKIVDLEYRFISF